VIAAQLGAAVLPDRRAKAQRSADASTSVGAAASAVRAGADPLRSRLAELVANVRAA